MKGWTLCQKETLDMLKYDQPVKKPDDVKNGRHMKGWTLCQKETLPIIDDDVYMIRVAEKTKKKDIVTFIYNLLFVLSKHIH